MRHRILLVLIFVLPLFSAERIKSISGVAKANVKAVGPVAEANIKAVGAVDNTSGGGAAISFNAASAGVNSAPATITVAVTISAATDGYVVVGVTGWEGTVGSTINSATFDGGAMTALYANTVGPTANTDHRMFGLAIGNKGAGSYNVVVSATAGYDELAAGVVVLDNVHQTVSAGTAPAGTSGTGTTPSITATTAAGEWVVDVLHFYSASVTATAGADQTKRAEGLAAGDLTDVAMSTQLGASGGVMSWTFEGSREWGMGAVPIKPANP